MIFIYYYVPSNTSHNNNSGGELLQNSFTAPIMLQLASPIVGKLVVPLGAQLNDLKGRQGSTFYPKPTSLLRHIQLAMFAVWLFQKVKFRPAGVDILPATYLPIMPNTTCITCLLVIPKGKISAGRSQHSTRNPPFKIHHKQNLYCLPLSPCLLVIPFG